MMPEKPLTQSLQKSILNISLALQAIEAVLPDLFTCYRLAVKHKLHIPDINKARIDLLEIILPEIRLEIEKLNSLVSQITEHKVANI